MPSVLVVLLMLILEGRVGDGALTLAHLGCTVALPRGGCTLLIPCQGQMTTFSLCCL